MERAIVLAEREGLAGRRRPAFDLEVRVGAGAYICGEETSMLESLEGKRGAGARQAAAAGASRACSASRPSINNVLSLATVPIILADGAAHLRATSASAARAARMPIQLAGNIKHGGLVEEAFGVTLRELVDDIGGGTATGRPVRAVQVGGPLGAYFPRSLFDTPLDYEAFAAHRRRCSATAASWSSTTRVDMARQARFAMEFCAIESCGKCTPCRIGSTRGVEVIDRIIAGEDRRGEPRAARRPLRAR